MTDPQAERSYAVTLSDARGRWFTAGAIATALLSFPTQVLFEWSLGIDGFAQWLLVNSLVTFFVPLASFGASNLILSEYFHGRLRGPAELRALGRYFAGAATIAIAGFVVAYAASPLAESRTALDIAIGAMIVLAHLPIALVYPLFQIHHRSRMVALWPALQNLGRFLVAIACMAVSLSVTGVLGLWLAVAVALAVAPLIDVSILRFPNVAASESSRILNPVLGRSVVSRGLRFGIAEYLDSIDLKLAIPVGALFLSTKQIAGAGFGLLFLNAVHFFPYVLVTRFLLPALHSEADADRVAVRQTISRWILVGSGIIAVGAVGFMLLGDDLVRLLAKGDYGDQKYLFAVVGAAMLPLCVSILLSGTFMRIDRMHQLLTWRIHATLIFLLSVVALASSLGAAALFVGIIANRSYLIVRFATAATDSGSAQSSGMSGFPDSLDQTIS